MAHLETGEFNMANIPSVKFHIIYEGFHFIYNNIQMRPIYSIEVDCFICDHGLRNETVKPLMRKRKLFVVYK